jgi:hypothetical protein
MTRAIARFPEFVAFTTVLWLTGAASVAGSMAADGEPVSGWRVIYVARINVEGSPVALSPDGAWMAGTTDDDQVCIWAVADLAATCTPEIRRVDPDSFAWAPDSSAVAFSALTLFLGGDSDIHVLDTSGALTNVTDDGFDDQLQELGAEQPSAPVPVDLMPAWTPDSTAIVFSRVLWNSDDPTTDIMTVPRAGGEPTLLGRVDRPTAIYMPMHVLRDGAILYAVGTPQDPDDTVGGIWRLDPDGTTTQLIPGHASTEFPVPAIADVSERDDGYVISGYSVTYSATIDPDFYIAFSWSSAGGEPDLVAPVTKDDRARVQAAVFSPDGGSTVQLTALPEDGFAVEVVGPATSATPLPVRGDEDLSGERARFPVPTWSVNDTVLVPATVDTDPLLVTMAPA